MPTLFSECALIENFIPENYMASLPGYYFITLKACATYFADLD